jgi:hypothetical protein
LSLTFNAIELPAVIYGIGFGPGLGLYDATLAVGASLSVTYLVDVLDVFAGDCDAPVQEVAVFPSVAVAFTVTV